MEITLEEIKKKFDTLPEDLKWAIMGAGIDDKIIAIGQMHGLRVEKMGQLSLETYAVMLGYTHPDMFEESLQGSLQLPKEKTHMIAMAINERILKNVRERLISLYQKPESQKNSEEWLKKETTQEIKQEIKIPTQENTATSFNLAKTPEPKPENTEKTKIENNIISSISAQKLTGSFKVPTVNTEHTTPNISKQDVKHNTGPTKNTGSAPVLDPYRADPNK